MPNSRFATLGECGLTPSRREAWENPALYHHLHCSFLAESHLPSLIPFFLLALIAVFFVTFVTLLLHTLGQQTCRQRACEPLRAHAHASPRIQKYTPTRRSEPCCSRSQCRSVRLWRQPGKQTLLASGLLFPSDPLFYGIHSLLGTWRGRSWRLCGFSCSF